ncbi:hypothetical protein HYW83_04410 [Candidatus Peregrinibacteria bacterium]|nr:hypothetical protein [Candidatus Peregrinibacteria bacterium]
MIKFLSLLLVASFFLGSQAVLAEDPPAPPADGSAASESVKKSPIDETFNVAKHLTTTGQGTSTVSTDSGGIANFIVKVIDLLVKIIGSVALIVFILGALLTVTSEGKEDRLEKGKTAMLYALIGLIIAFFSFIIVTFVQSIFF